ncbi:MAG: hypothetical protein ACXW2T_06960 [Allosphingosinicella sp.]
MTKSACFIFVLAGLLAGCSAQEEESVEERFKRTEAAIENTAETLEAETENAVSATEKLLENRADAFENSVDAIEANEVNQAAVNQAR